MERYIILKQKDQILSGKPIKRTFNPDDDSLEKRHSAMVAKAQRDKLVMRKIKIVPENMLTAS